MLGQEIQRHVEERLSTGQSPGVQFGCGCMPHPRCMNSLGVGLDTAQSVALRWHLAHLAGFS